LWHGVLAFLSLGVINEVSQCRSLFMTELFEHKLLLEPLLLVFARDCSCWLGFKRTVVDLLVEVLLPAVI